MNIKLKIRHRHRLLAIALITILVTGMSIFVFLPGIVSAQQYARPDADITLGSWTTSPLWSKIDETSFDDADFIHSTGAGETFSEIRTADVTDPVSSTGHILRFRMKGTGSGAAETVNMQLYQGATLKAQTGVQSSRGSFATKTYTLSGTEANSITDYTDLRFRFVPVHADAESVDVSWAEFEIPSAGTLISTSCTSGASPLTMNVSYYFQGITNYRRLTCTTDGEAYTTSGSIAATPTFTLPSPFTQLWSFQSSTSTGTTCADGTGAWQMTSSSQHTFPSASTTWDYCTVIPNTATVDSTTFTVQWDSP